MSTGKTMKAGRPRDEAIRVRILETAVTVLKRRGYRQATMNEIALKSRVGKQTLYRWWKNRAELLMEALLYNAEEYVDARGPGDEAPSLLSFILRVFNAVNRDAGVILRSLVAEGIADKRFLNIFFTAFIARRQETLSGLIREHSALPDVDPASVDALVDIIFGAMWYRLIFGHRPLDEKLASFLSNLALRSG